MISKTHENEQQGDNLLSKLDAKEQHDDLMKDDLMTMTGGSKDPIKIIAAHRRIKTRSIQDNNRDQAD
jgi:hypothetical protein